ncbi:hypothetical protein Pla108_14050 [Botrimarina colliarenosi]|uniref:Uncharacterized protein n=1 Tax=Botrimarina colliarenosi TaxID=2528001 RepID=A0A5C6AQI5_9BACT|nr:hypothetical protein [Botrimarina colliarenosi]TWU00454.1 hypothetical protein Pla108_14050 [Botrimarina colliarenosi]
MRRNASDDNESLDLLLDAISNTFGGVLFIAVLVVILLQFTGETQTNDASISEPPEAPEVVERRQQALELLQRQVERQNAMVSAFGNQQQIEIAKQIAALASEAESLSQRLGVEADSDQQRELRRQRLESTVDAVRAQSTLNALRREVEALQQQEARSAKLPRMRKTVKSEFPMIVTHDRLYWLYEPRRGGSLGAPRWEQFEPAPDQANPGVASVQLPIDDGSLVVATPKRNSGMLLLDEATVKKGLGGVLRSLDASKVYLAIAVWEDSFDSFGSLRNAVVDLGFEYRLMPQDKTSTVGSGGTGDALVQ